MAGRLGRYRWLSTAERAAVVARFGGGARVAEVMAEFGLPATSARRIRDEAALMGRRVDHSPRRLSFGEREEIFAGICRGESDSEIARVLGRHRATIGREVRRCGGRRRYRPLAGERIARRLARRPKPTKLAGSRRLLAAVREGLERCWSPQQISARLRLDHPGDEVMRISHETIYRSLYVQSRGELRRQLTANLRTGRSTRRSRGRIETRGRIVDMVAIAQRPPEVDERRVPGHWEGDLLLGAAGKSAIATLVERNTRFVLLD
jgi:IS30 family transposase